MNRVGTTTTALLGPTNTGKTHRAVERMLSHDSGMIGLPLRLLAREIYDRVSLRVGEQQVALITGEEKRTPPQPRYWVCTVEAMPLDREVDFLAVDEIQLAAQRQRGHTFTDRLLHARGRLETWFLGAASMRPLVEQLLPTAQIRSHARLSKLKSVGGERIGELRPRSAVVAFSMARVYELAERLRVRRGGAAVVLGALSPRARNAQVALYESGEVDYLVATDAIGMGLNLDVDHVSFAELHKFDGQERRPLRPAELAQVAGRAGRHLHDGTFGTLAPLSPLDPSAERAIENHQFPAERRLWWRSRDLDLDSVDALIASLRVRPPSRSLRLDGGADDFEALLGLARDPSVRARATSPDRVETLWQVCQIPDYRQLMLEDHVELLRDVFLQLTGDAARLDREWIAHRLASVDVVSGGIDDLLARMAFVRTWTYISHRAAWLTDAKGLQERTRDIEDRLSDALHASLMERFVDRPAATAVRRAAKRSQRDEARLRDSPFASLADAFATATPTETADPNRRVELMLDAPFASFVADAAGVIPYEGQPVAELRRGADVAHPEVVLLDDALLGRADSARVLRRLVAWSRDLAASVLGPIGRVPRARLSGPARGLFHLLESSLGTILARQAREQLNGLDRAEQARLHHMGIRVGREVVYLQAGVKQLAVARRVSLAAAYWGRQAATLLPSPANVSFPASSDLPAAVYTCIGFPVVGGVAVRADVLDRVEGLLHRESSQGPFLPSAAVGSLLACGRDRVPGVVAALGYRRVRGGRFARPQRGRGKRRRPGSGKAPTPPTRSDRVSSSGPSGE